MYINLSSVNIMHSIYKLALIAIYSIVIKLTLILLQMKMSYLKNINTSIIKITNLITMH